MGISRRPSRAGQGGFYAIEGTNVNPNRPIQRCDPAQNDPAGTRFPAFRRPNQPLKQASAPVHISDPIFGVKQAEIRLWHARKEDLDH